VQLIGALSCPNLGIFTFAEAVKFVFINRIS